MSTSRHFFIKLFLQKHNVPEGFPPPLFSAMLELSAIRASLQLPSCLVYMFYMIFIYIVYIII